MAGKEAKVVGEGGGGGATNVGKNGESVGGDGEAENGYLGFRFGGNGVDGDGGSDGGIEFRGTKGWWRIRRRETTMVWGLEDVAKTKNDNK